MFRKQKHDDDLILIEESKVYVETCESYNSEASSEE